MKLVLSRLQSLWKVPLVLIALLALGVLGVAVVGRVEEPLFPPDYSSVVLDEDGGYLRIFLNHQEQWILPDSGRPVPERLGHRSLGFGSGHVPEHPSPKHY